jgi:hypothetical protein
VKPRDDDPHLAGDHGGVRLLLGGRAGADRRAGPFAAFDCTWTDAIGGIQVSWAEPAGWTGSVIQLECGAYDPFRFHIRLFPAGHATLANAHVEVLIPGTQAHQVLNWEVADQFIVYEMARVGILGAAPATRGMINQAPTMGEIPVVLYNMLPAHLRALAGGPQELKEQLRVGPDGLVATGPTRSAPRPLRVVQGARTGGEPDPGHPSVLDPGHSTRQNAMPAACWPTSTSATRSKLRRSKTSTLPASPPTPSTVMKA